MTGTNEWTHWHLTPRGWERGSMKANYQLPPEIAAPGDRVLTVEYREKRDSPMVKTSRELWRSDDDFLVKKLLEKYGPPPIKL